MMTRGPQQPRVSGQLASPCPAQAAAPSARLTASSPRCSTRRTVSPCSASRWRSAPRSGTWRHVSPVQWQPTVTWRHAASCCSLSWGRPLLNLRPQPASRYLQATSGLAPPWPGEGWELHTVHWCQDVCLPSDDLTFSTRRRGSEVKLLQDKVTHCGQSGGAINIYDTHPSSFSRNDGYIKIKSDLFAGCKIRCPVVPCFETVHQEWFELGVSSAQLRDNSLHLKIITIITVPPLRDLEALEL